MAAEADIGRNWLLEQGVDDRRITIETRSRDSLENLRAMRELGLAGSDARIALVSSRYHLYRVSAIAAGLGISHLPCAADDRVRPTPKFMYRALLEGFLVHWLVVGRTWARWTRNERMLARIT